MDDKTMNLDEIEQKLDSAQFASDLFGPDNWSKGYKKLATALHPDKFTDPDLKKRAESLFLRLGAWKSLAEAPETIKNGDISYVLGTELGRGDVSSVRIASKNGVSTAVVKISVNPGVSKLLLKEQDVLKSIRTEIKNGANLRYFSNPIDTFLLPDNRRVLVFDHDLPAPTAEVVKEHHPKGVDARHLVWMFKRLMSGLSMAHRDNWLHGAVLPQHMLVDTVNHGIRLIGWSLAIPVGKPIMAVPSALKEWYPPECKSKKPATPATDIYLAAKSLCWLAGGDPLKKTFPDSVPRPIQTFLQGCMLEPQSMRPQEAGALIGEMSDVAYKVYGPPKFHVLEMQRSY